MALVCFDHDAVAVVSYLVDKGTLSIPPGVHAGWYVRKSKVGRASVYGSVLNQSISILRGGGKVQPVAQKVGVLRF